MNTSSTVFGVCLSEEHPLALDDFARACGIEVEFVGRLVDEGLVQPLAERPDHSQWCFGGEALARVRRLRRLQRDFDANLHSVAVMLDLIDEVDRLRAQLRRLGVEAL